MLQTILQALLAWLALLEHLAARRRLRGLSWSRGWASRPAFGLVPLLLLATLRGRRATRLWALLLAAPLAVATQVLAANWGNRGLNARARLVGGSHERSSITRLDIPMEAGHLPALHVVPAGGAQKSVVVLHGSGCDKTFYAWPLVDALVEAGCAVLLVDLDGHGENPRVQRFPHMLDDAWVAVAWLRQRYERVGMIGLSLGGCIAARAVADGLLVERLAVLEAPPQLSYSRADIAREAAALAQAELLHMLRDSTPESLVQAWQTTGIRAEIGTVDLIAALDLLGSLPKISAPLLLIYGARDAIVKPGQARQAEQAKPQAARFVLLPGASHLSLQVSPRALRELQIWFADL